MAAVHNLFEIDYKGWAARRRRKHTVQRSGFESRSCHSGPYASCSTSERLSFRLGRWGDGDLAGRVVARGCEVQHLQYSPAETGLIMAVIRIISISRIPSNS